MAKTVDTGNLEKLLENRAKIAKAQMIYEILDLLGNRIPQDLRDDMHEKAKAIIGSFEK